MTQTEILFITLRMFNTSFKWAVTKSCDKTQKRAYFPDTCG